MVSPDRTSLAWSERVLWFGEFGWLDTRQPLEWNPLPEASGAVVEDEECFPVLGVHAGSVPADQLRRAVSLIEPVAAARARAERDPSTQPSVPSVPFHSLTTRM